jgi:WhiB family redox-sensing transcriptional regulator
VTRASLPLRGGPSRRRSDGARREGTDWRDDALCTEVDPDIFFPTSSGVPYLAKQVCLACPVRQQCLDFAMSTPVEGVWGGTTVSERKARAKATGGQYRTLSDSDVRLREQRVLDLHATGLLDTEIGKEMGIAKETVQRIRKRLGVSTNRKPSPMPETVLRRDRRNNQARRERNRQAAS